MTPSALIVDDNIDLAENLLEILQEEGWECDLAEDGEAALNLLDRRPFDLVITDLKMEGMSGLDVLRAVTARWPQTPVIIITAFARDRTVQTAREEGAVEVLAKPIDMEALLQTVQRLLESRGKVLLVEDEDDLRSNLIEIFSAWPNFEVAGVGSLHDALEATDQNEFNVAIIDMRLPDGDGLQLAQMLRTRLGPRCPQLLFTSAFAEEIGKALQDANSQASVLAKPFSPGVLVSLVRRAV